VSNCVVCDYLQ